MSYDIIPKKLLKKYNKLAGVPNDEYFKTYSSSRDKQEYLGIVLENLNLPDEDFDTLVDSYKCTYLGGYSNSYKEGAKKRIGDIFLIGAVTSILNYVIKRINKYE